MLIRGIAGLFFVGAWCTYCRAFKNYYTKVFNQNILDVKALVTMAIAGWIYPAALIEMLTNADGEIGIIAAIFAVFIIYAPTVAGIAPFFGKKFNTISKYAMMPIAWTNKAMDYVVEKYNGLFENNPTVVATYKAAQEIKMITTILETIVKLVLSAVIFIVVLKLDAIISIVRSKLSKSFTSTKTAQEIKQ